MRKASYYTELTRKSIPYFHKMMNAIEQRIFSTAEKGYTRLTISLEDIANELNIYVEEDKFSSLRNLVIKEIKDKGFAYGFENSQLIIYW